MSPFICLKFEVAPRLSAYFWTFLWC